MKSLTPSRPQRRFLAGAVAAVMVLAAGLGYRVAGRGALDATLTRVSGSDEALAGFTLYGQTRHNTANAVTTFTLQNGVFTSETDLDARILTAEEPYFVRGGTRWAVAPAAREEVNAAAEAVRDGSDTLSLQSEASRFRLMLSLDVPGRGTAQLPVEEVETLSPVAVRTKLQAEGALYDWLVADTPQLLDTSARDLLTALDRQSWTFTPDAAYFAMPVDTLTAPAGLCKVEAIPDDLWAARQNEQAIEYGGKTYAAGDAAEEIGSVSTLYTPADAASCVATFAAGESLGLVYVTTDNIVKADLVDAAGNCTASVELLTLAEGQHVENCFRYPPAEGERRGVRALLLHRRRTAERAIQKSPLPASGRRRHADCPDSQAAGGRQRRISALYRPQRRWHEAIDRAHQHFRVALHPPRLYPDDDNNRPLRRCGRAGRGRGTALHRPARRRAGHRPDRSAG